MGHEKFMKWNQVKEEQLWAYLGFSILMAINHLPSIGKLTRFTIIRQWQTESAETASWT